MPPAGDSRAESPKNDLCPTPRRMSFNVSWNYGRQGSYSWGLTFDMSGGRKQAKPAGGRPLDGRVGPRRGWERTWAHAADGSHDRTAQTMHLASRRVHARSPNADRFELTVAHCSKCLHISSQPARLTARWPPQDGQPMGRDDFRRPLRSEPTVPKTATG